MAELPLPFSDTPEPETDPDASYEVRVPQASGLRKAVVIGGVMALAIGVAIFVLFASKSTQKLTHRPTPAAAEEVPRSSNLDPLRGFNADYDAQLKKSVLNQPLTGPPQAAPAATTPPSPQTTGRQTQRVEKKEVGMLILEGKKQREATREAPVVPQYLPGQLPAQEPTAQASGPLSVVDRQRGFLQQAQQQRPTQVEDRLHTPESPFMVLAGDIIPATLVTGINSDLPGELTARARQNLRDSVTGTVVLIPQGTILLGTYNNDVVYGQDRVLVVWHRLRLPNGQTMQLEGMPGIDLRGQAGLKGKVDNHLWPLLRGVILSSVLSVGSRIPAGSSPQNYQPNLAQEFAQDFGSAANRAGQQIVQRELQRPPTIMVPGKDFNIYVLRDLVLQPYVGLDARGRK